MPAGGTRPAIDAGGKVGSAARAGAAQTRNANTAAKAADAAAGRILLAITMQRLRGDRVRPRALGSRASDPAQSQIDPSALREQGRSAGLDAVDAMKRQPIAAAENQCIARTQPEGSGRI